MKKILVIAIVALLVLAGCSSGSNSTPEEAFNKAKEALVSGQTIDFSVATVIKTEMGDIAFDNFGKIVTAEGEDFAGVANVKAKVEGAYEDLVIYVSEGTYYLELKDEKTIVDKVTLKEMGLVDFTEINSLVSTYDEVSTEAGVHTYTSKVDNLDTVKGFSVYADLNDHDLVAGSLDQTLIVENDKLVSNTIYINAVFADATGKELPVTQAIELKYSAPSKIESPDFTEFK